MTPREVRKARLALDLTLSEFGGLFNMSGKTAWRWEQERPDHNTPMPDEFVTRVRDLLQNNQD